MLCGPYRIEAVAAELIGVLTNKVPTGAYRGAGRPEATYIMERVMDRVAHELQLDPVEVRRRNLLAPDVFPYKTPTGLTYDSGNYQAALDKALALADYSGWRERQRERRERHDQSALGIGVSTFIEITGGVIAAEGEPQEAATVRILPDGTLLVLSGVASNGQGHFTAFGQIAAQVFNVPASSVEVRMNDSALPGFSLGTFGSRVAQTSGSAVLLAAEAVREKAVKLAADRLEAAPDDLEVMDGRIAVRGVPTRNVQLAELARAVEEHPELIEHEPPNPANGAAIEGLAAWRSFTPPGLTFTSGAHLAVVEVDGDTGEVNVLRYVAVDDCGRVVNHYLTRRRCMAPWHRVSDRRSSRRSATTRMGRSSAALSWTIRCPKPVNSPPSRLIASRRQLPATRSARRGRARPARSPRRPPSSMRYWMRWPRSA